ncbi:MAG: hypothetical protein ACHQJ5_04490 [Vicinamibacteria bacterium]
MSVADTADNYREAAFATVARGYRLTTVILSPPACSSRVSMKFSRPRAPTKGSFVNLKRHLVLATMLVAVGVFFAGLTIAQASSGDEQGGTDEQGEVQNCQVGTDEPDGDHGDDDAVKGSGRDDDIEGTDADDEIDGDDGDDQLDGNEGDDDICGDDGADEISGGAGDDDIDGGGGSDDVSGNGGNDEIFATRDGADDINCGAGKHDVVHSSRNDDVAANCEVVH